jgi:hypothetical protein
MDDMRKGVNALPFPIADNVKNEVVAMERPLRGRTESRRQHGDDPKKRPGNPLGNPRDLRAFQGSGRLDLNQRPLGPEPSALPG